MKKEEFPTFLNEQPTIIFGRTGRELLIIAIGLGMAYISWLRLGSVIHGNGLGTGIVKVVISLIVVAIAATIAFVKVATRTLEEWGFIWLFYTIVPKTYIYLPEEEGEPSNEESDEQKKRTQVKKYSINDDDDFSDD